MNSQKPRKNPAIDGKVGPEGVIGVLWALGMLWFVAGLIFLVRYMVTGDPPPPLWGSP